MEDNHNHNLKYILYFYKIYYYPCYYYCYCYNMYPVVCGN
jgi:hypothetical protein